MHHKICSNISYKVPLGHFIQNTYRSFHIRYLSVISYKVPIGHFIQGTYRSFHTRYLSVISYKVPIDHFIQNTYWLFHTRYLSVISYVMDGRLQWFIHEEITVYTPWWGSYSYASSWGQVWWPSQLLLGSCHMYVCIDTQIHTCKHANVRTIRTYIYIYICIYYIHTHIGRLYKTHTGYHYYGYAHMGTWIWPQSWFLTWIHVCLQP